jgi:thioredoxin 1
VIEELRASQPAYDRNIAFINVDWDEHPASSPLAKKMGVAERATLILLHKDGELGRLAWETSKSGIAGLLDKAPARPAGAPACSG